MRFCAHSISMYASLLCLSTNTLSVAPMLMQRRHTRSAATTVNHPTHHRCTTTTSINFLSRCRGAPADEAMRVGIKTEM